MHVIGFEDRKAFGDSASQVLQMVHERNMVVPIEVEEPAKELSLVDYRGEEEEEDAYDILNEEEHRTPSPISKKDSQ